MRRLVLSVLTVLVLTGAARADVLEDVKAAVDQAANSPPRRQRSFERTMGGLGLAVVGARLVWYRLEDKDCREARGLRCDAAGWGGALRDPLILSCKRAADVRGKLLVVCIHMESDRSHPTSGFRDTTS